MNSQHNVGVTTATCLVDLENLCGGSERVGLRSAKVHKWVTQVTQTMGPFNSIRVIAATGVNALDLNPEIRWHWHDAEFLFGHGIDGADRKLLDVLRTDKRVRACDDILIWSGDGCFARPVKQLHEFGCRVTALSWVGCMSKELREEADRCFRFQVPRRCGIEPRTLNAKRSREDQAYVAV